MENRFELLEKCNVTFTSEARVLRDNETGVCYLFYASGYAGGLTPLLDAAGKPIVIRD